MNTELTATQANQIGLPTVVQFTEPFLQSLTSTLHIDRNVLATDTQIQNAWHNLQQLRWSVPSEKRDEGIMRMCVAVATGLFDSAVNYVWNAAVVELREKVRQFGLEFIQDCSRNVKNG